MSAADASDADDRSSVGSLRLEEDKEWEDAENDEEQLTFVSLFDGSTFPSLGRMLEHCREKHDFDLVSIIQRFGLYVIPVCTFDERGLIVDRRT